MTDDPIKLFVVVMAILLCVLAFVSYKSYEQAAAFEGAIDQAERDAKTFREHAAEVEVLCAQLKQSKLNQGYKTLIDQAAAYNNLKIALKGPKITKFGVKGQEWRFTVDVKRGSGTGSAQLRRDQIAKFCRTVEKDSRNILKTIELRMTRATGKGGAGKAGMDDEVVNDTYTVTLVFGLRVLSS